MRRLPVLAIIREAHAFTFANLGAIIGLIWLPMVIATVAGFFAGQYYFDSALSAIAAGTPAVMGPAMLGLMGSALLGLLLYSVMYAAITQLVLGTRQGGARVPLHFGAVEWRLFRAVLGFAGLGMLAVMALATLMAGAALAGPKAAALLSGPGGDILFLAAFCVFLLAAIRFLPLMPAVAVSEEGPVLPRAWMLTAGNFWRLLLVMVALVGPPLAITLGAEAVLLGPSALLPDATATTALLTQNLLRTRAVLPVMSGITFFISPLLIGLVSSASVAAWRALSAKPGTDFYA